MDDQSPTHALPHALIIPITDYNHLNLTQKRQLADILGECNHRRMEEGSQTLSELNQHVQVVAQNPDTMPNTLNANQKIQKYEDYIRSKGDDPQDVLYGRDEPETGESQDQLAKDAIDNIRDMNDVSVIKEFVTGDDRTTVLEAARERIAAIQDENTPNGEEE